MREILAWIFYVILQILFIPLAIVGIAISIYSQSVISKKLGVSGTAAEIASERMIMDRFGLREDRAAGQLVQVLPNVSILGGWLILFPWYIRYKLSGKNAGFPAISAPGKETVANSIVDRTVMMDQLIQNSIISVTQFVILGAGYDTRCYGSLKDDHLRFFEVDQALTQQLKRACLLKAGIDASHVHFVEVDFVKDDWAKKLKEAGYDPEQRSLFLWEGVTLYLSEDAVRKMLREIRSKAASGSVLVCDFYAKSYITGKYSQRGKVVTKTAKMSGEAMGFGLDFSQDATGMLHSFLASENLITCEIKLLGEKTKKGSYMAVVEIKL